MVSPAGFSSVNSKKRRIATGRRGMALVIVLSSLVLLSILVVSILTSARQEVTSSNSYGAGSDAKLLADLPLSLVTAQIAKATSDPDLAWISQPGLLRTFSSSGQQNAFKLYSSYEMEKSGAYDPGGNTTLSAEVPNDWSTKPNEFVDLNRPIQFGTRKIYPIADPNAYNATTPASSLVQGFSYDTSAISPSTGNTTANLLPMPVRWIYVTANGSLVGAGDTQRKDAVARIAFWADDETSKVNINTACGGVFYDTPCTNTLEDHMLGRTQPIAQEYQRWPGHPATTSLAPVIKSLRIDPITNIERTPVERSQLAAGLTPRIAWGGSSGGTKYAWLTRELGATDMDRLYATPDELSFGKGLDSSGLRVSNTVNGTSLENGAQKLDELRFFLTTQSRAPELTLFNRPRISLWPFNEEMVQTTVDGRLTPEDRLIRFASELGGVTANGTLDYTKRKRFYFQRRSAWDPAADWRDIPANRAIFRYLQDMTARQLPSAKTARSGSGTFVSDSKFGKANRDSILTCMWDYLRSGVNTVNQAYVPVGFSPYSFPQGHDTETSGFNDVAPLVIAGLDPSNPSSQTKGMGRFPVLTEMIFQFVNVGDGFEMNAGAPIDLHNNNNPTALPPVRDGMPDYVIRKVRMVVLLNFQMPISSLHGNLPRLQVKITGAAPFSFVTDNALLTPVPSPLMNSGLSQPINVRNPSAGNSTWSTTLTSAGIGFPAPASGTTTTFRNTNYIGSFFNGRVNTYDSRGGPLGPGFGMYAVIENKTKLTNKSRGVEAPHRLKVLSNRTSALSTDDQNWLNSSAEYWMPASATSWAAREDVYYPFVSDVIEFRLPQKGSPTTLPIPIPLPTTMPLDPVNIDTQISSNGTVSYGKDYFEAFLSGGSLDVAIYPGLKDSATVLSPINSNWQDQTSSNYLMHTTINVGNTFIPLPRPGPDLINASRGGNVTCFSTNITTLPPTFQAMGNYYERTKLNYVDNLLQVPSSTGNSTIPTVTTQMDVFRSYLLQGGAPLNGDLRLAATRIEIPSAWWQPHPLFSTRGVFHGTSFFPGQQQGGIPIDAGEKSVKSGSGNYTVLCSVDGDAMSTTPWDARGRGSRLHSGITIYNTGAYRAASPATKASSRNGSAAVGDFSQGFGNISAGAVVGGPDLGGVSWETDVPTHKDSSGRFDTTGPYFSGEFSRAGGNDTVSASDPSGKNLTGLMYSPFKQVPSPVIFGTIPSRAGDSTPGSWETLLFCPNPAGGKDNHRGWKDAPRDHFLLDLFYMPVVEPYAITENFATSGKVNLNYQIAPFTYIKRKTALYALMDSMTANSKFSLGPNYSGNATGSAIVAVPDTEASNTAYRTVANGVKIYQSAATSYRKFVDPESTLKAFDTRFDTQNDPFVSASEICEMFLNPVGEADAETFWATKTLTGDDKREMPYNHLYPRVTTRSNTFRVHFWVQSLNPRLGRDNPIVTGEYRGSTIVERYLDPNITEYGTDFGNGNSFSVDAVFPPLNDSYRFRQIEHQQFAP